MKLKCIMCGYVWENKRFDKYINVKVVFKPLLHCPRCDSNKYEKIEEENHED